jgi:hypothetical protein
VFGKLTANVEIAGPFKIETKPYTMTIASKTDVSPTGSTTSSENSALAEPETAATEPVVEKESSDETLVNTRDESISETEPTEITPITDIEEAEVPADVKRGNWTVVSVAIGVSAAAAGIVILKITKIV